MESTEAILLRKRKFSDTSLIVSWCTESLGCVQTIAKGARRQKSPFAGKLDLFFEAEISIVRSRKSDLHTLAEVVLKNPFAGIRSSYLRTQTAAYFVELIEICTERDHREPELFGLMRRAFGYLDANDPTARAVAHFETELARLAGVHDQTRLKADPASAPRLQQKKATSSIRPSPRLGLACINSLARLSASSRASAAGSRSIANV